MSGSLSSVNQRAPDRELERVVEILHLDGDSPWLIESCFLPTVIGLETAFLPVCLPLRRSGRCILNPFLHQFPGLRSTGSGTLP
ncbi:hypothetical protein SETIT_8G162800v2 [Setaria italica]|uniref:Uncharacterized protein n=1 Tax=Setaria italica TaxID=4555 RepID=A0A368S8F3_SETIT|nr:hypothetical protein SETIT_8G162800v2 [Setaria italica]